MLLNLLTDPDSYPGQPLLFLGNQVGHAAVIGALPVWLGVPWWAVLAIFAVWELAQYVFYEADLHDALEDFGRRGPAGAAGFHFARAGSPALTGICQEPGRPGEARGAGSPSRSQPGEGSEKWNLWRMR